jgi:hypothetical protein
MQIGDRFLIEGFDGIDDPAAMFDIRPPRLLRLSGMGLFGDFRRTIKHAHRILP